MSAGELITSLNSGQFRQLLDQLRSPEINHLVRTPEVTNLVAALATVFHRCVHCLFADEDSCRSDDELIMLNELINESSRLLRNSCAVGNPIQNQIADFTLESCSIFDGINLVINSVAKSRGSSKMRKMCWQFIANLCVQNESTQRQIWTKCIDPLLGKINCVCETENSRECTMILYNLCIGELLSTSDVKKITELLIQCILDRNGRHELEINDFHQLFMEHLIVKYRSIVAIFDRLTPLEKRLHLIYNISDHMKILRHDPISTPLLQFICKEFKKKSDCVLKATTSAVNTIHPREVVALLEVIAQASSDERYSHVLSIDKSLFINVGCLLRSVHEIGKRQPAEGETDANIFAPVQKLNQLAPNSSEDSSIERDISYQLKSMLIRTLANLVYKNKENQDLAREMEFVMAVLDSTALDARNPLIKEWSILAIRNLCENNMENQQLIGQLTKVGDSKSDVVKEFNLDLGSLRINPNVE